MMLSLAWSTLRARKGGFIGAFTALLCAAALITACGVLLETGLRGGIPTERYAGTPVVVTADQNLHWTKHKKGKEKVKSKPLPERAWLAADTADRLRNVPGVRAVVPELTFPATAFTTQGAPLGGPGDGPSWGHAWDSAVLTPFALTAGTAPTGPDDVVLDADLARRAGAAVGSQVTVQSTAAPKTYRVTGIAAPQDRTGLARQTTLFFHTAEAARLAGHPGQVAALGILTAPGADTSAVADDVKAALAGTTAQVRTGDARGPVEFIDAAKARVTLISLGGALGGTSLLVAILVVCGTFALSLQQRRREIALLRAVGATPRQIRRMVGLEAVFVGLLAGALGAFAGLGLARWMHGRFVEAGAMPKTLELAASPFPAIGAVLATVAAAWAAARISARRPARIRPTEALADAAIESPRIPVLRTVFGAVLLAGYIALLLVLRNLHTDAAATPVTFLSVVLAAVAVSLLGPVLARAATAVLALPMRLLSPVGGRLAASNNRARLQRVAAVVTPLALAIGMTSTILFVQTTTAHAASAQVAAGTERADYVLASAGPGVPRAAVDAVRNVPGVAGATQILRTNVRAGQDKFPAQGVTTEGAAHMLDLKATAGDLGALVPDTVAVSTQAARTKHVGVGDPLEITLGDGVKTTLRVVAVYERGLGFGDLTLPHDLVAAHVDNPLAAQVLIRTDDAQAPGTRAALDAAAAAFPGLKVLGRAEIEAARKDQQGTQAQVNYVAMGLIIAFTAIAIVNTLVMATAARTREFALMRLVGMTRRQILLMLRWETLTAVLTATVLGTAIAWGTLSSYAAGMTGTGTPYAPPATYAAIVGTAALLALAATVLPARLALRARPADAIGTKE
ncbi:FtsX-like permease family protein [Yinghuangia soli]|uniref:FtsX-like permease family protein n=1 Tax=Yinghuangia soli TaxID=2908204 RepID=A0AA41U0R6_9ACTN|nr:FtsX-like permease family protein [Yinghuangia soli]MCF2526697.1 FtsX-like permease family protein [Yinghuangia soli]